MAFKEVDGYNVVYKKELSSTNNSYETIIYDKNGHTVAGFEYDYTSDNKIKVKPMVAMYLLDGYTGIYKDLNGNNYILSNENKYYTNDLKYGELIVYLINHIEALYISNDKDNMITQWVEIPVIQFIDGKEYEQGSNFNVYDFLVEYLNSLGITFINNDLKEVIENVHNTHTLIDVNWNAFGKTNFNSISYQEFDKMFTEYKPIRVDLEAINALNQEPKVMIEEQVVDEMQYQNLAINEEIEVLIDSVTGAIDLSKINITVPKKQLFSEGNKYRLVVQLTSVTCSIELAYQEVIFNNDSMIFTGFTDVIPQIDDFNEGEQYTLAIYLAGYTSEGYLRMTNDIKLNYNNFSDFEISGEKDDNQVVLSFKYTDKLIVELYTK